YSPIHDVPIVPGRGVTPPPARPPVPPRGPTPRPKLGDDISECAGAGDDEGDGSHIEHIGGPGLHVAVDSTAKEYYSDYYGEYGDKLTEPVHEKEGGADDEARVAAVRAAWLEVAGDEPEAADVLRVLGELTAETGEDVDVSGFGLVGTVAGDDDD